MTEPAPLPITPPSRWRWPALAALVAAMAFGAWQLAFLCDDAYINFRYVANAHAGHGLVWNPAPFEPVEGYTGVLWLLLLWGAWRAFGIEPPELANGLSFAFGCLLFAVLAAAALRLRTRDGRRARDAVGLVALAVIVGNRTFLQWLTGGFETALFNLTFVGWVLLAFAPRTDRTGWWVVWSGIAAVSALTRADGLLLVAATVAAALWLRMRAVIGTRAMGIGLAPLAVVVAHVLWRRSFYGEWLPNTWFAKVVEPWPDAGLRYAACFAVEHGTWVVGGLALVWIVVEHVRNPRFLWHALRDRPAATAAVATCFAHAAYYVFRVGGDHFEYRVFSQQAPLLVLAIAAMSLRLVTRDRLALGALVAVGIASCVAWLHLALTRDDNEHGFQRLAPAVPAVARPLARWYDRQQAVLQFQNVCVRCTQHARLLKIFFEPFPTRLRIEPQAGTNPDPFPIVEAQGVGVLAWSLPDCAVLDHHGLNDWVIARTPVRGVGVPLTADYLRPVIAAAASTTPDGWFDADEIAKAIGMIGGQGDARAGARLVAILLAVHARERLDAMTLAEAEGIGPFLLGARSMAHERHPPAGYIEAFAPNVQLGNGRAIARPRAEPMTAERIRSIEADWRERARTGRL